MGELLSSEEQFFDPTTTLLWDQVLFRRDGGILLHIRVPKIPSREGDFLDLFPFEDKSCCPVLALKKLFLMQNEKGMLKLNLPVFRLPSGKNLTPKNLNVVLEVLLGNIFRKGTDSITCHSMRSAIPTALHETSHSMAHSDTREWGRWKSTASQHTQSSTRNTKSNCSEELRMP
jgi:hypothetical protein